MVMISLTCKLIESCVSKKFPSRLKSPEQKLRQSTNIKNGLWISDNHLYLQLHGRQKSSHYDPSTPSPTVCREPGIESVCNFSRDNETNDSTNEQRQVSHWCRRVDHMDAKKLKEFDWHVFLQKGIVDAKSPLCSSRIQAKKSRTSISKMAS